MKIVDFRKFDGPISARGFRCVARFHVELEGGLRVLNWQLVATPEGNHLAYPPAGQRGSMFNVPPAFRAAVIDEAMEFMNDRAAA